MHVGDGFEQMGGLDVLVIGGGNAALCVATSAKRSGPSPILIEPAPQFYAPIRAGLRHVVFANVSSTQWTS